MKTNVTFNETKFKIKGNKTTCYTEAIFKFKEESFYGILSTTEAARRIIKKYNINKNEISDGHFVIRESASVKCSADDTFDETLGKRLAQAKVQAIIFDKISLILYDLCAGMTENLLRLSENNGIEATKCIQRYIDLGGIECPDCIAE